METNVDVSGPRVRLRRLTSADVDLVLGWAKDPEVTRNFSFFEKGAHPDRIRSYIEEKTRSAGDLLLAVMERAADGTEHYAGNVGLHEWDAVNDNARLGIILAQTSWGRGLAQEALCVLMQHAFGSMGLHKVYLNVFTSNDKGIHLYEKLGFVREGVMRHEYKLKGEYRDMLRMSIVAPEWPTSAARTILAGGEQP